MERKKRIASLALTATVAAGAGIDMRADQAYATPTPSDAATSLVTPESSSKTAKRAGDGSFQMASYNVLGSNHPDGGRIVKRTKAAVSILRNAGVDVAVTQEMRKDQFRLFKKELGPSFDYFPGKNGKGNVLERTIFWDTSEFKLLQKDTFFIPRYGNNAAMTEVTLENRTSGKAYIFTDLHLGAYGGRDHGAGDRKKGAQIVRYRVEHANTNAGRIVSGDLNSANKKRRGHDIGVTEAELPANILKAGGLMQDAREVADQKINGDCSTHSRRRRCGDPDHTTIDKILSGNGVHVYKYENVISKEQRRSSDHHPLIATIK